MAGGVVVKDFGFSAFDFAMAADALSAVGIYLDPLARKACSLCGTEVQRRNLYRHRVSKSHRARLRRAWEQRP